MFQWHFPDLTSELLQNPSLPNLDDMQLQIQQWLVHEGDWVEVNQPLITLATEDRDIVLTADSPVKGVLKSISLEAGSIVSAGTVLATFELDS